MAQALARERESVTDSELVRKCQQGDRNAFRFLYRRYRKRVRSTLYQLCGISLLDDLEQEVFYRAWKGLPKLRKVSTFSTWIYRISWNVASDQRRRFAQWRERETDLPDERNLPSLKSDRASTTDLMQLHYQQAIERGLQALSLDQRAVVVLHDLEDLPQKEIAQVLDIPVGTVKSRLFHARKALRRFLETEGVSP